MARMMKVSNGLAVLSAVSLVVGFLYARRFTGAWYDFDVVDGTVVFGLEVAAAVCGLLALAAFTGRQRTDRFGVWQLVAAGVFLVVVGRALF